MPEKKLTSYPKEKINILFLENISDVAVKHFNTSGYTNVKKINAAMSEGELIEAIRDVHLLRSCCFNLFLVSHVVLAEAHEFALSSTSVLVERSLICSRRSFSLLSEKGICNPSSTFAKAREFWCKAV